MQILAGAPRQFGGRHASLFRTYLGVAEQGILLRLLYLRYYVVSGIPAHRCLQITRLQMNVI